MRLILLTCLILLTTACSSPSSDPIEVINRTQSKLGEAYAYFGTNEKELELFIEEADPSLADRILVNSMQSNSGNDYQIIRSTQMIVARMEQLKAPPVRYAQLCERLRFVVIRNREENYPWARFHENLCVRGMQADTALTPASTTNEAVASGVF